MDCIIEEVIVPMLYPKKDVVWGELGEESVGAQKEWGFNQSVWMEFKEGKREGLMGNGTTRQHWSDMQYTDSLCAPLPPSLALSPLHPLPSNLCCPYLQVIRNLLRFLFS